MPSVSLSRRNTRCASSMTSGPTPSPGITAMVCILVASFRFISACGVDMSCLPALDQNGDTLSAADARACDSVFLLAGDELAAERQHEPRAGGAERMPERDGAAVDVCLLTIETEIFFHGEILRRERLVDFEQIDVLLRKPGFFEQALDGGCGTDAHLGRVDTHHVPRHDLGHGLQAVAPGRFGAGQHETRRAVHHAAGIAGGNGTVFAERGSQLREAVLGGIDEEVIVALDGGTTLLFDGHDFIFECAAGG